MGSLSSSSHDEDVGVRKGPWTLEEDTLLIHYIAGHGEGRWNLLAKRSGLRRTGKSCRLRWLNYLKPDVKRGNLTPQEQLLILQLHSKWGNRWSKIAQHLPGRTDNEIKNYWRTRVQKQARHLKMDTNSRVFQEVIRCYWMPRLLQMIEASSSNTSSLPMSIIQNPITATHEHDQNRSDLISHGKVHHSLLSVQGNALETSETAGCNSSSEDHHYSTNYSIASSSSASLNNVLEIPEYNISGGHSTVSSCSPHHPMYDSIADRYNTFLKASCYNLDNVNNTGYDMAQSLISLQASTCTSTSPHVDFGSPFGHEINCDTDSDHFVDCLWNMYG